jgi:hypothetical protein
MEQNNTLFIDADGSNIRTCIHAMFMSGAPLIGMTSRAVATLVENTGSLERAAEWLHRQILRYRKPVLIHVEGVTHFYAPPSWSAQKREGFIIAHREFLEGFYGPIESWEMGSCHDDIKK